jgi:hypothetical protein
LITIASLCLLPMTLAQIKPMKEGQRWSYRLTWQYQDEDSTSRDEESFDVLCAKVLPTSYTLTVEQKLIATIIGEERIPAPPGLKPISKDWSLFTNGSVAFYPDARFELESRLFRIFQSILPAPVGSESREASWSQGFEDDGLGMPKAALFGEFSKVTKEGREYRFSYREGKTGEGVNGQGAFIRSDSHPFPVRMRIRFTGASRPGGTEKMNAEVTLEWLKPRT